MHADIRDISCVQGVKGVCTVEQLCEYLSRDDHDEAFSLRSAVLPLTSTWPAAEGAPMLRPPVTTAVARQWMPEASLSSFWYVASVPNITATVADATLRLGSAGCILVPESSHIMLCNMTITGAAHRLASFLVQQLVATVLRAYSCNV